ncbi:MAG: efflux RND transporter periplasmic adaptor subunit [Oscillochloridaceae bacterium umkhey_bin13]
MAAATSQKRKRPNRRMLWIIGGIVVAIILIGAAVAVLAPRQAAAGTLPAGWQAVPATSGSIAATVGATGNIEPQAEASLRFETTGTVAEIFVGPGDQVTAGQALARIDTTGLELGLAQAQADLRQAQADLEGLLAGASETEVAEAEARLEQARRQVNQATRSVSQADINAARAELESARARLARLEAGPTTDSLASANERVQAARTNLENSRVALSTAKERARLDLETRANALRNAQDEFSRIYWRNRELENAPGFRELPRANIDQEAAAQRAVNDAEAAMKIAQNGYDQARSDEINSLRAREAELASAEAARDRVLRGSEADELASARAAVQRAQASLDQLTGSRRESELATQQSSIEIAQANLDRLLAPPTSNALAAREASVTRAELAVRNARRNLDLGTLRAPFAATIGRVDMRIGEPSGATAIIAIVDLSSFHVDLPVDELDIAEVELGQAATIELDALPGQVVTGKVTSISPQATRSETGTTTYQVTVTLDAGSNGVRPGMTAVVSIITEEKPDVVLVPRRAVRSEGGQSFVLVPNPNLVPPPAIPGQTSLPGDRRPVTLGISNSQFVEIVSGLNAGEEVLVQDVVSTFNPAGPPR